MPHHGLDLVDPDEPFSAADYQRAADAALRRSRRVEGSRSWSAGRGCTCARWRGVSRSTRRGTTRCARADIERDWRGRGCTRSWRELRARRPAVAASTDLANPRRVVARPGARAVCRATSRRPAPRGYPAPSVWIGLAGGPGSAPRLDRRACPRAVRRGSARRSGRDCVRATDRPCAPSRRVGYQEAFAVLDGELTVEQAIDAERHRNRQFARRQRTWFRARTGRQLARCDS